MRWDKNISKREKEAKSFIASCDVHASKEEKKKKEKAKLKESEAAGIDTDRP